MRLPLGRQLPELRVVLQRLALLLGGQVFVAAEPVSAVVLRGTRGAAFRFTSLFLLLFFLPLLAPFLMPLLPLRPALLPVRTLGEGRRQEQDCRQHARDFCPPQHCLLSAYGLAVTSGCTCNSSSMSKA